MARKQMPAPQPPTISLSDGLARLSALKQRGEEILGQQSLNEPGFKAWSEMVSAALEATFGSNSPYCLPWPPVVLGDGDRRDYYRDALFNQVQYLGEILSSHASIIVPSQNTQTGDLLDVFLSHSSEDQQLADAVVSLLRATMNLSPTRIRCTSVDGYKLVGGTNFEEELRTETLRSTVFIALITPNSLLSKFTLFEIGARWGSQRKMFPILGRGASASSAQRPLNSLTLVDGCNRDEVLAFVQSVAEGLGKQMHSAASWLKHVDKLISEAKQTVNPATGSTAPTPQLFSDLDVLWGKSSITPGRFDPYCPDCQHRMTRVVDFLRCKNCGHENIVPSHQPRNIPSEFR